MSERQQRVNAAIKRNAIAMPQYLTRGGDEKSDFDTKKAANWLAWYSCCISHISCVS